MRVTLSSHLFFVFLFVLILFDRVFQWLHVLGTGVVGRRADGTDVIATGVVCNRLLLLLLLLQLHLLLELKLMLLLTRDPGIGAGSRSRLGDRQGMLLLLLRYLRLMLDRWTGRAFSNRSMSLEEGLARLVHGVRVDALLDPAAFALGPDVQLTGPQVGTAVAFGLDEELLEEAVAADARKLAIAALQRRVELGARTDRTRDVSRFDGARAVRP